MNYNRGATLFRVLTRRPVSRLPLWFRMGVYRWWAIPTTQVRVLKLRICEAARNRGF